MAALEACKELEGVTVDDEVLWTFLGSIASGARDQLLRRVLDIDALLARKRPTGVKPSRGKEVVNLLVGARSWVLKGFVESLYRRMGE